MLNEGSHTEKLHATMIPANDIWIRKGIRKENKCVVVAFVCLGVEDRGTRGSFGEWRNVLSLQVVTSPPKNSKIPCLWQNS
jgi:hypothetical protein